MTAKYKNRYRIIGTRATASHVRIEESLSTTSRKRVPARRSVSPFIGARTFRVRFRRVDYIFFPPVNRSWTTKTMHAGEKPRAAVLTRRLYRPCERVLTRGWRATAIPRAYRGSFPREEREEPAARRHLLSVSHL